MRLGGPVFLETHDPDELARAHREEGYRAAYCPSFASLEDLWTCRKIESAFRAQDVVIAEVGVWCNIIGPDEERRRTNIERVCRGLALADEVGALGCVDYPGTLAPDSDFAPDARNFSQACLERIVDTARGILAAVKPKRAKFMFEMMPWVFPDDAESYVRIIEGVDDPRFGVHLDPVNIISSPRRYFATGDVIRECFAYLGPHVVSCHAKDVRMRGEYPVGLEECPPGQGNLDYRAYLAELNKLPQEPPLMLEHLSTAEQYRQARDHIVAIAVAMGVKL